MAAAPKYKIYRRLEYIGCVKHASDAAVLVSVQPGGTVRLGHSKILYAQGVDGDASDSYDEAAELILKRESAPRKGKR